MNMVCFKEKEFITSQYCLMKQTATGTPKQKLLKGTIYWS